MTFSFGHYMVQAICLSSVFSRFSLWHFHKSDFFIINSKKKKTSFICSLKNCSLLEEVNLGKKKNCGTLTTKNNTKKKKKRRRNELHLQQFFGFLKYSIKRGKKKRGQRRTLNSINAIVWLSIIDGTSIKLV